MTLEQQFDKMWTQYPSDLTKGRRGGRQPAFKAFKKLNPDEKEFNRIMANMKAQAKADRADPDSYRWPFLSSYLNQSRFDDYIAPATCKASEPLKTCTVEGCNNDVHGAMFKYCGDHIPNAHSDEMAKAWTRTGLSYKSENFVSECREYCRERLNILLARTL